MLPVLQSKHQVLKGRAGKHHAEVIALGMWIAVLLLAGLEKKQGSVIAKLSQEANKAAMVFLAWTFASSGVSAAEKWLDGYVMELVLSMASDQH